MDLIMERKTWFFRLFFVAIAVLLAFAYEMASTPDTFGSCLFHALTFGTISGTLLISFEFLLRTFSPRDVSTAVVGLFVGSLMGLVLTMSVKLLLASTALSLEIPSAVLLFVFLTSIYLGIMLTATSAESWWLHIPFVRLAPASQDQKREILLDLSAIEDVRLIELCRSGLLDQQLVVPTFIVKDIQKGMESLDESQRLRARRCHENLKRLESMEHLKLQQKEFHFNDNEEISCKLTHAAKLIQAHILTSQEQSAMKSEEDETPVISLETIAAALKPGAQRGEILSIKIQRLGKEPKQGVGYLDDGTMVVVNGGGEFLGQSIRTQVLSQKYSSSGKIIFCNALAGDDRVQVRPLHESSPYYSPVSVS
jgi:uncharacterized protein YacL